MSAPALHADVWVIHDLDAVLLKHTTARHWHEQMRMPIDQFMGSASGLSSLACHDTVVLINLPKAGQSPQTKHCASEVWASVEDSPLRLIQSAATQAVDELIHNIGLMGAKPHVVSASNLADCIHANRLMRMSQSDATHLQHWVDRERSAPGKPMNQLRLLVRLIAKPPARHQRTRLTVFISVTCTALLVQWSTQQQFANQHARIAPKPAPTKTVTASNHAMAWQAWRTQLEKINTGKKPNLLELQWMWQASGTIHTQATFEKPRKRVPKGCELTTPLISKCSTNSLDKKVQQNRGAQP